MKSLFACLSLVFLLSCGSSDGTSGSTVALPPGTTVFNVVAGDAPNAYTINGVDNPSITLVRGTTYTFNIAASGHPFFIMAVQGTNVSDAYTFNVTNNGATSGQLFFTPPAGAPSTLWYDCSVHAAMTGTITIN